MLEIYLIQSLENDTTVAVYTELYSAMRFILQDALRLGIPKFYIKKYVETLRSFLCKSTELVSTYKVNSNFTTNTYSITMSYDHYFDEIVLTSSS